MTDSWNWSSAVKSEDFGLASLPAGRRARPPGVPSGLLACRHPAPRWPGLAQQPGGPTSGPDLGGQLPWVAETGWPALVYSFTIVSLRRPHAHHKGQVVGLLPAHLPWLMHFFGGGATGWNPVLQQPVVWPIPNKNAAYLLQPPVH